MNNLLKKTIDLRQGEAARTSLMFGYIFLIIASYLILKPMTRSLFLKNLGPAQLPFVYMLVAGVVGVVAVFYARLSSDLRLDRLINATTLFLMANLLIFWWLLTIEVRSAWLYYGLYIWASIYGVLTTSQFWLLANYVFNPREAKRIFPLLAAAAILGGISGGYFTRAIVKQIGGTANLAFFCIAFLGATIVLMNLAWRLRDTSGERSRKRSVSGDEGRFVQVVREVFTLIRSSRHLALLMGIVAMIVMVSQIADFQFSTFASQEIAGTDELTGFLGFWLSNLSVISLAFQVLIAGAIIRRFGVGVSILFLPVAMLITSLWVFVGYGLVSILAIKISDGAFRYSINKAGLELLYLPIPQEVKKKTKTFVDMFADRLARGVAGLLLLIFYTWIGLSVAQISLISVVLVGVWLVLVQASRREYVNSFRQALEKRRIDADSLTVSIEDEATINTLIAALGSRNERQVAYALDLLDAVEGVDIIPPLRPLLQHASPEIRLRTLNLLLERGNGHLLADIQPLVRDPDTAVRRAAVRYFCRHAGDEAVARISEWLRDENVNLKGAALHCAAEVPTMAARLIDSELIESLLEQGPEARAEVADALAVLNNPAYHRYLLDLLDDEDPQVRQRSIAAAARTRAREFVPILVKHLIPRTDRVAARQALARYGDAIAGTLSDYLNDADERIEIRREIPRVLSLIRTQRSVDVLLDSLPVEDQSLRYQVVKALNKLRAHNADLDFDSRVEVALTQEAQKYYELLAALHCADGDEHRSQTTNRLLDRALRERLDDHLERIFRLLGLVYPPRDIYNAYAATTSSNRTIRASAVEFLDNLLPKSLKRVLLPIVDELPVEQVLRRAHDLFNLELDHRQAALQTLARDRDCWLRACTIYEIGVSRETELLPLVEEAEKDNDPVVRETATMVRQKYLAAEATGPSSN